MRKILRFISCLMVVLLVSGSVYRAEAGAVDMEKTLKKIYPALLRINVVMMQPSGGRFRKLSGAGSGVIISKKGYVVTNHHVAGKASRIICRMPDGEEIDGILVGTDALADIAIIKLDLDSRRKNTPLPVAVFGDSDRVKVGDVVYAMGCPAALSQSVTKGIVSNTSMILPKSGPPIKFQLDGEDTGSLVRWIGHDAVIFGGNSGGPLVNEKGEIIGINEVGIGSLGGAIPGNLAKSVADQLIKTGDVKRSWIGMEFQPRLKDGPDVKGALVSGIIKDSPAEKAGFKAGDIVLAFDGAEVDCRIDEDMPVLNQLILATPINKKLKVKILRDGAEKVLKLKTQARELSRGKDRELKLWGITVRDLTLMSSKELRRENKAGVYVGTVRGGGPCSEAKPGMKDADIITEVAGKTVEDINDLKAITKSLTDGKDESTPVLVAYERKGQKFLTVVKLGKQPEPDKPARTRKPWLPVLTQVLSKDLAEALGMKGQEGVRVTKVFKGHSAEEAGVRAGDIILKLDGEKIQASRPEDHEIFSEMIRQYKIGAEVEMEVMRDGKARKMIVVLEKPVKSASELARYKNEDFELTVREISFDDRVAKNIDKEVKGVLVERVEPSGWASLGGLLMGDIIVSVDNADVADIEAVEKKLKEAKEKRTKRVVFFVKRGIHSVFLEMEPNWESGA